MRKGTIWILIGISLVLIGWDVLAYAVGGPKATVSIVVRDFAQSYPSVPFLLGVLAGHVLWPLPGKTKETIRYVTADGWYRRMGVEE